MDSFKVQDAAWCPGCGNFMIRAALSEALGKEPDQDAIVLVSGIGQAAKMPQYLPYTYFNGLHGRSLPVACGIKLARPELTVVAVSGDGCMYGEGGNHFLHTLRRHLDLTILVCDNKVYGLTKGQSSPTSDLGRANALDPLGNPNIPFNPLIMALAAGATFVARGFAGNKEQLSSLISAAIAHPGTSVIDVLQPCVSFNKENTLQWYKERVYTVDRPCADRYAAMRLAEEWTDRIPTGILYQGAVLPRREKLRGNAQYTLAAVLSGHQ